MGQYSQSALGACCDFGGKLEALRLLSICRIFCHSRMAKKGVCLARCTGELHPDPPSRIRLYSEVLELLLSGERNSMPLMYSGVLFGNCFLFCFFVEGIDRLTVLII